MTRRSSAATPRATRKASKAKAATPVANKPKRVVRRDGNPFTLAEVRMGRREAMEELGEFLHRHPFHVQPGVIAAACGIDRATVRKAVQAKAINEVRHKLPGGRLIVLVSLADSIQHFG